MAFEERQGWFLLLIVSALIVSAPFLVVQITPITDVAQQLVQIPLLTQVLSGQAPDLVVHWLHPNKASYLALGVAWLLFEPLRAARMALVLTALVWVAAVFVVARRRGRSASSAVLALPLLFNHSFGLGFLNFSVGIGAFAYWFLTLANVPPERPRRRTFLHVLIGSLLLYYCHALWLAGGLVWLAVFTVVQRRPAKVVIAQLLGAAPAIVLAASWYPSLIEMRWGASLPFGGPGVDRLTPNNLVDATFGSLRGLLEPVTLSLLLVWLLVAVWQHRSDLRSAVDVELLLTAGLFLALGLLLPDKVDRTYAFNTRWMPVAMTCLVLGLPPLAVERRLRSILALGVLAAFCWVTASTWIDFEREELAGLHEALAELPPEPRLLGLDFVRDSPRVKYPVYLQMHAYGQLLHGGMLNFSFVRLGSSLVVRRDFTAEDPWTAGLEWRPDFLQPDDLDHFDHVLMHAPPEIEQAFRERIHRMVPATPSSRWRLFRILPTALDDPDERRPNAPTG